MTETDKQGICFTLDDVVAYCHWFSGQQIAACGVPRRVQSPHNGWCPANGYKFCPVDGLKTCPKCVKAG